MQITLFGRTLILKPDWERRTRINGQLVRVYAYADETRDGSPSLVLCAHVGSRWHYFLCCLRNKVPSATGRIGLAGLAWISRQLPALHAYAKSRQRVIEVWPLGGCLKRQALLRRLKDHGYSPGMPATYWIRPVPG